MNFILSDLAICVHTKLIWSFQVRCSSRYAPRNFVALFCLRNWIPKKRKVVVKFRMPRFKDNIIFFNIDRGFITFSPNIKITSSINSRVRLWKINHSDPGCSFYEFYEWYIFQYNTRVYIRKIILVQGFCPLKIEITPFPDGFHLN